MTAATCCAHSDSPKFRPAAIKSMAVLLSESREPIISPSIHFCSAVLTRQGFIALPPKLMGRSIAFPQLPPSLDLLSSRDRQEMVA